MAERRTILETLPSSVSYVPNENFRCPKKMREIMGRNIVVLQGQLLSPEDEQTLFLQLNYSRYKLEQVRKRMLAKNARWKQLVPDFFAWNQRQLEARAKTVTANMGLVLAMAKRSDFPGVEFTDLVSEGSMALLRATDKFDASRGFKFSTYACRAIFKAFSRTAKQSYRYRNQFPAQWDVAFERDDSLDKRREEDRADWVDEVRMILNDNLAGLSGVEESVVRMRFSLDTENRPALTLKQVGDRLGLTKERIRQIQNKALQKLRTAAEERMVVA
jgi:RNA polymerase sigma factor (sigma-70 family)